jgi:hypothetical protein
MPSTAPAGFIPSTAPAGFIPSTAPAGFIPSTAPAGYRKSFGKKERIKELGIGMGLAVPAMWQKKERALHQLRVGLAVQSWIADSKRKAATAKAEAGKIERPREQQNGLHLRK